ncbi:hypothetical protein MMC06_004912 [Schaereria dolodes]|nr:hypothetical protein [Schaereria dolodes]
MTYVRGYSRLDPTARIILIRGVMTNMLYRPASVQQRNLQLVVEAIRAEPDGPLLAHLFSNAGAQQMFMLAAAYRQNTGHLLPIQSMILDSTPGLGIIARAKTALVYELPTKWYYRLPGTLLVYFVLFGYWLLHTVSSQPNVITQSRNALNDICLIRKSAKRCYIYSEADELVLRQDVEEHCDDAEAKGWTVIREKFEGSAHVRHAKVDPDRYWSIVGDFVAIKIS